MLSDPLKHTYIKIKNNLFAAQQSTIRHIHAKFGVFYSSQSPNIGQISGRAFSQFLEFQSKPLWIKVVITCNLISNSEIDMKLGPLFKIVKRSTTTSTKILHDNDILESIYDVIVIFQIFVRFGTTRKPDSGQMAFYLAKAENRTRKPLTQPSCSWLEKMYIFCLKRRNNFWFSCK